MIKSNKIQKLLITHLLKYGSIQLNLPDNMKVEIGINQENKFGDEEPTEGYCYVIAAKEDRATVLDSFNISLRFADEEKALVFDDTFIDKEGAHMRQLNVI
jgi:hypothetical protein